MTINSIAELFSIIMTLVIITLLPFIVGYYNEARGNQADCVGREEVDETMTYSNGLKAVVSQS